MIVQNMYPLYTLYSDPIPVTMHYFHSNFTYNPVVEIQTHPWMKMPTLSPTSRDGERLPLKTSKATTKDKQGAKYTGAKQGVSGHKETTKANVDQIIYHTATLQQAQPLPCSQGSSSPSPQGPPPPLSLKVATALLNLDLRTAV